MVSKHAQSAMESAMLITFMTAILTIFLAMGTQKLLDVRANKDIALIEDVGTVIDAELKLAVSAQEGYIRVFELPYSIGGHNYTVLLENNSAVYISYAGYLDNYTAVVLAGRSINGTIRPGPNRLTKTNTTILITPFCFDEDNDGYGNMSCYGNDCNDENANINPGKLDICGNSIDEDCTGTDAACDALTCAIRSSDCNSLIGETDIMHISLYGGHAELPSQNNYPSRICCSRPATGPDAGPLDTTCSEATFAKLSAETNAHVEKSTSLNYLVNACMSAPDTRKIECSYADASDCAAAGYTACLFTMSSQTNAIVSDCQIAPLPISVCCRLI
ncbi:putative metal-binding motif-containing protein [Candidatus Woesearchaeota archaeon]|nr:putative metal-binding motif-containing protein [Candidatus Woesearchaeota archaeon]